MAPFAPSGAAIVGGFRRALPIRDRNADRACAEDFRTTGQVETYRTAQTASGKRNLNPRQLPAAARSTPSAGIQVRRASHLRGRGYAPKAGFRTNRGVLTVRSESRP